MTNDDLIKYKKLIDRLWEYSEQDLPYEEYRNLTKSAAAISVLAGEVETLQAENTQMRTELEAYKKYGFEPCDYANMRAIADKEKQCRSDLNALMERCEQVCAELDQVRLERDAAVEDINSIANAGITWMCPYCKHCKKTGPGYADCDVNGACKMPHTAFEWRGSQKEE